MQNALTVNLSTLVHLIFLPIMRRIRKYALDCVFIDCSKLEYISSTGLRVLLIMQNDCEGGVIMKSCNENNIEILSDTNNKIK